MQAELPELGPKQYKWVLEAGGIAAYHRQSEWPVVEQLVCDDADQFKRLFATQTGYQMLDERIAKTKAKTKAKKAELLPVLEQPALPLHNNAAEPGARQRKPKENISYGPRTPSTAKGWDIGLTLGA